MKICERSQLVIAGLKRRNTSGDSDIGERRVWGEEVEPGFA